MADEHPHARKKGLIVRIVQGEVLVYDLVSHRAHCLNAVMAALWRRCNGRTSAGKLARTLQVSLSRAVPEEVVRVGLHRLGRARLLEASVPGPSPARRDWLRQATMLGLSIASIGVPTLVEAASSISDLDCTHRPPANCSNLPCSQNPGNTCRRVGAACSCSQN
jgi:hypothetical protein